MTKRDFVIEMVMRMWLTPDYGTVKEAEEAALVVANYLEEKGYFETPTPTIGTPGVGYENPPVFNGHVPTTMLVCPDCGRRGTSYGFCPRHTPKWDETDFAETLEKAPEWDGHTPADVLERLKTL